MARCEELEAILRAQFELEYAEPDALDGRLRRLNFLLDQVIAGTSLTRLDLLSARNYSGLRGQREGLRG